ncbi:ribonucleotide-diphosphate reductase subunit alpha [Dethiosulfatarculus sandiegensis]|uniref:Vitamin B12-dependent ribonucleotide reductase n=1 Tax=Dethiosulfatarculus sandiegensis TaxID=1429043 RepID=A0A0D2K2R8_9BACT|nr:ribonucleotide-diphosphate reductase subunit alpha [Dethiosulfatarculus sandiegensis]
MLRRRYLIRDEKGRVVETPERMLQRVARAMAGAEEISGGSAEARIWEKRFLSALSQGLFLPNSPTLMNAGRPLGQLSACFVLPVEDSLEGIFETVKQAAIIHKTGGGTGFDFSGLRPAGDQVASTGGISSGPVSFMQVFDTATEAIKQGGVRRGANMGILHVSHPDIELFIRAKTELDLFSNFNLSVMVTDEFMQKVRADRDWDLINPRNGSRVRKLKARGLFELMVESAHGAGEPGLVFFDALNRGNPTPALGRFNATNPCGEQPLLPYESCNLASLVLPRFVKGKQINYPALEEAAGLVVRFLDNALEVNRFPLPQVKKATRLTRKVGLGVMGFADLLIALNIPYESSRAAQVAQKVMKAINSAAREMSRDLARQRGSFPAFAKSVFPAQGETRMRNATVTTLAPTGALSLLMGCSAGIEPLFALSHKRRMLDDQLVNEVNPAFKARLAELGLDTLQNQKALAQSGLAASIAGLPFKDREVFKSAHEITAQGHMAIQRAFQLYTDNAVSKTVNLPARAPVKEVWQVFEQAHAMGLKGITVFRHGSRGRQVLELASLPGEPARDSPSKPGQCPRCGGALATEGGCQTCFWCGASGCE